MICLVIPPSPFLLDERVFMSLGVLKVAAALEAMSIEVEVLDLSGVSNYLDAVRAHLRQSPGDCCYGLTATSPQLPAACRIAELIKSAEANVPRRRHRTILGGPHATLTLAALKRERKNQFAGRAHRAFEAIAKAFDIIVAGDGELAILDALYAPAGAVLDADDRRSPYWISDAALDRLPRPARHLVDVGSYRYSIDGIPALSLIAQLGCPFGCGFCAGRHSPMLRHIRTRDIASIVDEMLGMWRAYDTRGFMFYDDELNVSPVLLELMSEIAAAQAMHGVEFRLRGFIKAELFTDEQAAAMFRAGFRWILVGFESGDERILSNINKKATKADNTRCIEIAHRHGLKVKALMSLGHPGESYASIAETHGWLLDVRPDDFDVTVITPYPGSPYYDEARLDRHGRYVYQCGNGDRLYQSEVDYTREADYYKGAPDGGYVSHVWTDSLTAEDLVAQRDRLESAVRFELDIPFNASASAVAYEHSMGQTALPSHILKTTGTIAHV